MKTAFVATLFALATAVIAAPAATVTIRFQLPNSQNKDVKVSVGTVADVDITANSAKLLDASNNVKCELSVNNSSKVGGVLSAKQPTVKFNKATLVSRISC